jgi:hypothetical protein
MKRALTILAILCATTVSSTHGQRNFYVSSPARATTAHRRDVEAWWIDGMSDLILRAAGGQNLRRRRGRAFETLQAWLARRR